uniref:Uncharacterized protein n=1 Tax=Oryza nivara TaxID=4536 RepID=A0A0E0G247_ORYNI
MRELPFAARRDMARSHPSFSYSTKKLFLGANSVPELKSSLTMSSPSSLLSHRKHRLKKSAAGAGSSSSASTSQPPPPSPNPKYTRFLTLPLAPSTPATCVMTQV